jgi:hypothetical protein
MKKIAKLASAALIFAALIPSAAFASSSTCQAYNPELCSVSTTTTSSTASASTLPFTGLDIALLVAGGLALTGVGFFVRIASRRIGD